jgi:acyl dehydratase
MKAAQVGDALAPLTMPPITTTQLVKYAGASGDFNRIHYDDPFAREAGFPSVIAHGMLSMAFLGQLVARWAGGPAAIARLAVRFRAVTFPGDVVTCTGKVVARNDAAGTLELELAVHKQDGSLTLDGTATLRIGDAP